MAKNFEVKHVPFLGSKFLDSQIMGSKMFHFWGQFLQILGQKRFHFWGQNFHKGSFLINCKNAKYLTVKL